MMIGLSGKLSQVRKLFEIVTQVYDDEINTNRNFMWSKREKAHLIVICSAGGVLVIVLCVVCGGECFGGMSISGGSTSQKLACVCVTRVC